MGLRNTLVRGAAGPNLATTVLNLTLTTATPGSALAAAAAPDLRQRAAGLLAILAGAVAGALLADSACRRPCSSPPWPPLSPRCSALRVGRWPGHRICGLVLARR